MQTANLNFDIASGHFGRRNADWQKTVSVTSSPGVAYDLTGYTMKMTLRPYAGATALATIQTSDVTWQGIKLTAPTTGQFTLQIAMASIAACPAPPNVGDTYSGIYDLIVTDPSGHTSCWAQGTFDIAYGVG